MHPIAPIGLAVPKRKHKKGTIKEETTRDILDPHIFLDRSVSVEVYNLPITFGASLDAPVFPRHLPKKRKKTFTLEEQVVTAVVALSVPKRKKEEKSHCYNQS